MKRLMLSSLFVVTFFALGMAAGQQDAGPQKPLSTEQTLRAKVQSLEETVLSLSAQLASCQVNTTQAAISGRASELSASRRALDAELIKALGGDPEKDTIDPATLTLVKAPPAPIPLKK